MKTALPYVHPTIRGRGAASNPQNRFERLRVQFDPAESHIDDPLEACPPPDTVYLKDHARSIITRNDSPDVGFEYSINPYRGCSHGCVYCYARPTHEFLGFSAGLDFEAKILVKEDAPQLLRAALMAEKYRPVTLAVSGVTDCYQPAERTFRITRNCLEVLREFRNPVSLITKNHLITRDIDLLSEMASYGAAAAFISVTTLDAQLSARMEPRTSSPARRLVAIETLTKAGIPVGAMVAPVVPGLTDHEMPKILQAVANAGAKTAAYVPIRLPLAVAPLFEEWLGRQYPDRKDKVLNRIRELRGGKLNDSNFGSRMLGEGVWAQQFKTLFDVARRRHGLDKPFPKLSVENFMRPGGQLSLF